MGEEKSALEFKVDSMREDVVDIKNAIKELTSAINRLSVVEERLMQTAQSLGRAFTALEKVEVRVSTIEKNMVSQAAIEALTNRVSALEVVQPETKRTNDWVGRAVWAAAAAAAVFAGKKVGLV